MSILMKQDTDALQRRNEADDMLSLMKAATSKGATVNAWDLAKADIGSHVRAEPVRKAHAAAVAKLSKAAANPVYVAKGTQVRMQFGMSGRLTKVQPTGMGSYFASKVRVKS